MPFLSAMIPLHRLLSHGQSIVKCCCIVIISIKVVVYIIRTFSKIIIYLVEMEVGGGIGIGNTCKSTADSCQCMTKTTTIL